MHLKVGLFMLLLCFTTELHCFDADSSPHIVFIVADDLGWNDVGWHNREMKTPNLDKLAYSGVILDSSYVQPLCSPSRSCFMTGYYPFHTGLQDFVIVKNTSKALPEDIPILPEELKKLGYTTHIIGKWHLGCCNWKYTPMYRGFDSFMGFHNAHEDHYTHIFDNGYDFRLNTTVYHPEVNLYSANLFANRAIDIINATDPVTDKLFLYLAFQSVHYPLQVPKKYIDMYPNVQDEDRRIYCGMVSAMDEAVGNITNALTDRGFMENILIIFTSDNGGLLTKGASNFPLRGGKGTLWEGGTRAAAFVYSPTLLKTKRYTNNELIHAVDWFPTIIFIAGGLPDPSLDGFNQWDTIGNNKSSRRSEFVYNIDELISNAAMRVGDFKLIVGNPEEYKVPDTSLFHHTFDNLHNKSLVQLFNVKEDPEEEFDISGDNRDIVHRIQLRLEKYIKTLVPAQNPPYEPKSNPDNYNGIWSPGWC